MSRYVKVKDGEPRKLKTTYPGIVDHKLACCDCGLVHKFRFKIVRDGLEMTAFRDQVATANKRRRRVPYLARVPRTQRAASR